MFANLGKLDDVIFECKEFQVGIADLFEATLFENQCNMTIRKNNLAVYDFKLQAAASCKDGPSIQTSKPDMQICQTTAGLTLTFKDRTMQARFEQMMTPETRQALQEALGQEQKPMGLMQDQTSTGWGKSRDGTDELTAATNQNKEEFDAKKRNLNEELTVNSDEKTKHMKALANTLSSIHADKEEMNEKDEQKRELMHEFDKTCAASNEKITEALFTRIRAAKRVRNELLVPSTLNEPSETMQAKASNEGITLHAAVTNGGGCGGGGGDSSRCCSCDGGDAVARFNSDHG